MTEQIRNVFKGKVLTLNVEQVTLPNGQIDRTRDCASPWRRRHRGRLDADRTASACCGSSAMRPAAGSPSCPPASSTMASRRSSAHNANSPRRPASRPRAGIKLGDFFSSPGVLTEVIHVYLARDLDASERTPEAHEVFDARWVPLDEAVEFAANGRLQDAKTIVGLTWAQHVLAAEARDAASDTGG